MKVQNPFLGIIVRTSTVMITVVFDHKNKVNYKKYQLSKKYCMFFFNLLEIYQMSNDMRILH